MSETNREIAERLATPSRRPSIWEEQVTAIEKALAQARREGIEAALDAIRKAFDRIEGGPAAQERAVLAAVRALLPEPPAKEGR